MIFKNFFILIFFLLFISCNVKELFPDKNLSFEDKRWSDNTWIRITDGGVFLNDTIDFIHGNQSLCFTNNWMSRKFKSFLFQYLSLPAEAEKVEVKIHSKSEIIDNAWLKVFCLDNNENIVYKDSIRIISPGKWTESDFSFFTSNTHRIYIEIHAESKDTFLLHSTGKQKLWVDHLQIKINKKIMLACSLSKDRIKNQEINEIKNNIIIDPDTFHEFERIEDFTNHRIIAFGESVHGSNEIQISTFEAIKYLMEKEQCKLLLMEIPFDMGLRINDYLLGNTSEDIESLMMFYNYNIPNLIKFFNWIRAYNENTQNKIHISGIDVNSQWIKEDHLLIYLRNQSVSNDSLTSVVNLVEEHKYELALNAIQLLSIEKEKKNCIIHSLNYRTHKLDPEVSLIEGNRDLIQFENAKFAIETLLRKSDKAAIYAHLGHVNKKNTFSSRIYIPNFGNYMQKKYRDDYFVVALLVGGGTISNTDSMGVNSALPLVTPPNGTIEDLCLRSGSNLFYKNFSNINSLLSGRSIGYNYVFNQFYPYSHIGRFNAIIFINNSHGYEYPQNWPKTRDEMVEYLNK